MQLLLLLSLLSSGDAVRHYIREERWCMYFYETIHQYDYALFESGSCMITSVNFKTYTPSRKSVTIDYGTWKQQQDTIYITCATGLGKNDTQRFLLSADKQKLIRFSSGQAVDTSKNKIYSYHPGAECPFEVREKIRLKVYDLGHL